MVVKRRRQVNARRPPGSKGRFVIGPHAVEAHLERSPCAVLELWLAGPLHRGREQLEDRAAALGVPVHRTSPEMLEEICGSDGHQGIAALLREFAYADLDEVAAPRQSLLVAADGVEDPRNLGALIRGVAAAGAGAVIIPRDRAAQITAAAEKAAGGVTSWLPVARVVNLARALRSLKERYGYWTAALTQDGRQSLYRADLPLPIVMVVGGEAGIRPLVRHNCDVSIRIPMAAGVESLNLAVAAAVACFELRRRHVDTTDGRW